MSDTVKHIFSELGILTVYSLYIFETIKFVFNHKNLTLDNTRHHYNTRNNRFVERHRLDFYKKKSTEYKGRLFFDCLPVSVKQESNSSKLLKLTKTFLIESAFYSIDEFLGNH